MTHSQPFSSSLFCSECQRYIGAADWCVFCKTPRPADAGLPQAGQPLWRAGCGGKASDVLELPGAVVLAGEGGMLYGIEPTLGHCLWTFDCGGALRPGLQARGRRIYAALRAGEVLAIDAAQDEARLAWRFPLGTQAGALAEVGQRIYIGDMEGVLHALDDTGESAQLAWEAPPGQAIAAAPAVWGRLALVVTRHHEGRLLALDIDHRGVVYWQKELDERGVACRVLALPARGHAAAQALALAAGESGRVRGYRLPDGAPSGLDYEMEELLYGSLVLAGGRLFLASRQGRVAALDLASGQEAWPALELGTELAGLALRRDVLYALGCEGELWAIAAGSGTIQWRHELHEPACCGLAAAGERLLVKSASQGWSAWPWHLAHWAWAAQQHLDWNEFDSAAAAFALAGEVGAAEQAWIAAGEPLKAARLYSALGRDEQAAQVYYKAVEQQETRFPVLAALHLEHAADHYEAAEKPDEADRCRRRAARMAPHPYLKLDLEPFNYSACEVGQPFALGLRLRNAGSGAAEQVRFRLGGRLERLVQGSVAACLPAKFEDVLEFENLVPAEEGEHLLKVLLKYCGEGGEEQAVEASFLLQVKSPPPGSIDIDGDAGRVKVEVRDGAPLPRVRIRGMAGSVSFRVVSGEEGG